jgi:hypothetical protein
MTRTKADDLTLEKFDFNDLDPHVLAAFKKFVKEDFSDIPLTELNLDFFYSATLQNNSQIIFINIFFDGSFTGTDPCFGDVVFSLKGTQARLLFNDIECAS